MAKGYPDHYGQSIFPQFGVHTSFSLSTVPVTPNVPHTHDIATGKGVLKSLRFHFDYGSSATSIYAYILIDDVNVIFMQPFSMRNLGTLYYPEYPFKTVIDAPGLNTFSFELQGEISFASSVKCTFQRISLSGDGFAAHSIGLWQALI